MGNIKIYEVEREYIDYLRSFDDVVREEKDHAGAKTRKYIGVLFEINNCKYFAPLASPKKKFNKMKNDKDFMKINGGRHGAINFNNMIPVNDLALVSYDIDNEPDEQYKNILVAQAIFIRKNKDDIVKIASELYELITGSNPEDESERKRIGKRCCKYLVLEEACQNYKKE